MRGVLFAAREGSASAALAAAIAARLLPADIPVHAAALGPTSNDGVLQNVLRQLGLPEKQDETPPITAIMEEVSLLVSLDEDAAVTTAGFAVPAREHWALPRMNAASGSEAAVAELLAFAELLMRPLAALADRLAPEPAVAIVGGSGFYEFPGVTDLRRVSVETPYGPPSAPIAVGRLGGTRVAFLARHGPGHALLPSEVNARANLFALKRLGVTRVLSVSAVGSLRETIGPGDVVVPDQFLDRTVGRPQTFFGAGAIAHVSLADPTCPALGALAAGGAEREGARVHRGGTYLCIEGPQFSTRAESRLWRAWGADVVGMTNLPEARLAREAELCYATLALPTDHDCWRAPDEEVRVTDVLAVLLANVELAKRILARLIAHVADAPTCACQRALDTALFTPPERIPLATRIRLAPVLGRRLRGQAREA